jgi:hypothetical protein
MQRLEPKPVHAVKRTVNLFISPPMALRSSRHSSQYGRNSAQLGITIVSKGAKTQTLSDPLETKSSNRSMYLIIFTPGVLCKRRQSGKSLTDGALHVAGER